MSSRRSLLLLALSGVALADESRAQDKRELARRVDAAMAQAAKARADLVAYREKNKPSSIFTDSMTIGDGVIVVYTTRDLRPRVEQAAAMADSTLRVLGALRARLRGTVFSVRQDTTQPTGERPFVIVGYHVTPGSSINRTTPISPEEMARVIVDQAVDIALKQGKTPFEAWRRGAFPLDSRDRAITPDWGDVRLDLVTTPSFLGKRCYDGDIQSCKMALGLVDVPDPVMAWYDSAARRHRVYMKRGELRRFSIALSQRCLAGSDADCAAALRSMGSFVDPPAGAQARATLLRQALDLGGEKGVERLLATTGSPSDALAAAAGMPIDTVVARWLHNVRAGSIKSQNLSVRIALVAIGWIAILAVLAMRSSRWR